MKGLRTAFVVTVLVSALLFASLSPKKVSALAENCVNPCNPTLSYPLCESNNLVRCSNGCEVATTCASGCEGDNGNAKCKGTSVLNTLIPVNPPTTPSINTPSPDTPSFSAPSGESQCRSDTPCSCCGSPDECNTLTNNDCIWQGNQCIPSSCGAACRFANAGQGCGPDLAACALSPCSGDFPFNVAPVGDCNGKCCISFQPHPNECVPAGGGCGNGNCDEGETCRNCPSDCGDCPPRNPQCSDGADNDGDGKVDYPADPGCSSSTDNNEVDEFDASKGACEAAGFTWIGTDIGGSCCANAQAEYFTIWQSDFNPAAIAFPTGCWNNGAYTNDKTVIPASVLNNNGAFLGCKVTDASILGIQNTLVGGPAVSQNLEYCANKGSFYCSYSNVWKLRTPGKNHDTAKTTPIKSSTDCCPTDYCWSGSDCVAGIVDQSLVNTTNGTNSSSMFVTPPYQFDDKNYRCDAGNWVEVKLKYNWEYTEAAYCPVDQCYYSVPEENPACVKEGFWKSDFICEKGDWTTRTKLLGLQLTDLAKGNDYTLFCDKVTKAANKFAYADNFPGGGMAFKYFFGDSASALATHCDDLPEGTPCANNLCAIAWNEGSEKHTAVGAAMNLPVNYPLNLAFLNLFPEAWQSSSVGYLDYCDQAKKDSNKTGQYFGCDGKTSSIQGTPAHVWYNEKTQSMIYSTQDSIIVGKADLSQTFLNFLRHPIDTIIMFLSNLFRAQGDENAAVLQDKETLYNTLYLSSYGTKAIRGTSQSINGSTLTVVDYAGYTIDICRALKEYCDENKNNPQKACFGGSALCTPLITPDQIEFSITSQDYTAFWQDLTAKIRNTKEVPQFNGSVDFMPEIVALNEDKQPIAGTYLISTPIYFKLTTQAPAGIIAYTWDLGETKIGKTDGKDVAYAYASPGTYAITLVALDQYFKVHQSNTLRIRIGANCNNGIKDGDEKGIDCAGSCPNACPTCTDKIKNGDEAGIDCGGSCSPCATPSGCGNTLCDAGETCSTCSQDCGTCTSDPCNNGIQDNGEAGIDCGGSCQRSCVPAPNPGPLHILASNPRYFTDGTGKAIYLRGAYSGYEFQHNVFPVNGKGNNVNFANYISYLKQNHMNFIRLWHEESTRGAGNTLLAYPMAYARSNTCCAGDGGKKFNLDEWDPQFFNLLKSDIEQAQAQGIYVTIMLFNGWNVEERNKGAGQPLIGHPYAKNNNINGVNGDPNNDGNGVEMELSTSGMVFERQKAYVRKVIDTVNNYDNVLYEIANEPATNSGAWQNALIDYIHSYEKTMPKQHPVGYLFNGNGDYFSPVTSGGAYVFDPPVNNGKNVVISDTDHLSPRFYATPGGETLVRTFSWESFTRGNNLNGLMADLSSGTLSGGGYAPQSQWAALGQAIGRVGQVVERLNMASMVPRPELCSSKYCIASDTEFVSYLPSGGKTTVTLSGITGAIVVEWYNPRSGSFMKGNDIAGGGTVNLQSPDTSGDWVLYLHKQGSTNIPNQASPGNSCTNGKQDAGETGSDCGGSCPQCLDTTQMWRCKRLLGNTPASAPLTWNFAGTVTPTTDTGSFDLNKQIDGTEVNKYYKKMTVDLDMHVGKISLRVDEGGHKYDSLFAFGRKSGFKSAYASYWQLEIKDKIITKVYRFGENSIKPAEAPTAWQDNTNYHVTSVFDAQQNTLSFKLTKSGQVVSDITFPSIEPISPDIVDSGDGLMLTFAQNGGWTYSNIHVTMEPGGPYWGGVRSSC